MEALCNDPDDKMAYIKSHPEASLPKPLSNWRDIGTDWANSLSLGTGRKQSAFTIHV
jgi:hypothetical protein